MNLQNQRNITASKTNMEINKNTFSTTNTLKSPATGTTITIKIPAEARFFQSDFCEAFTRCPWYLIPLIWLPIIALLDLYTMHTYASTYSIQTILWLTLLGFSLWGWVEYGLHRFIFHMPSFCRITNGSTSLYTIQAIDMFYSTILVAALFFYVTVIHFIFHGNHHVFPMDKMRLVMPPAGQYSCFYYLPISISLLIYIYFDLFLHLSLCVYLHIGGFILATSVFYSCVYPLCGCSYAIALPITAGLSAPLTVLIYWSFPYSL